LVDAACSEVPNRLTGSCYVGHHWCYSLRDVENPGYISYFQSQGLISSLNQTIDVVNHRVSKVHIALAADFGSHHPHLL